VREARLLVRGNAVGFVVHGEDYFPLPENYGLVHDPTGTLIPRCTMYVCAYKLSHKFGVSMVPELREAATEYWGHSKEMRPGSVAIPKGPWQHRGHPSRILYVRKGKLANRYHHDFEVPVDLAVNRRGDALRLTLPEKCVVNERGFVWP
jgi:hypothetical protein